MKIKQTLFSLGLIIGMGVGGVISSGAVYAAECAGVQTSIISCQETPGTCSDGTDPYEGSAPGESPAAQDRYVGQHGHAYGMCEDGSKPFISDIEDSGLWYILAIVINIMTAGVGLLAVAGIIYGSVLYTTAGGSQDQVKKAVEIIRNVVIGLLAFALMWALLNFIIPGGLVIPG